MTAVKVAIDVLVVAVAVAMVVNGARWFFRGVGAWYELRERLDAVGKEPFWTPKQPAPIMAFYLLVHPPAQEGMSELDRVDVEGRTAIARSWLWIGGSIATIALLVLVQQHV